MMNNYLKTENYIREELVMAQTDQDNLLIN